MYTSLVIEGGGSKNIAALGALYFLKQQGGLVNITNYAGTSSGAIICTLLNMGFDPKEIFDIVFDGKVNSSISSKWVMWAYNLFNKYGINDPYRVNKLITNLFESKGYSKDITFKELYEKTRKNLVLTGTNISKQIVVYFHRYSTPDLKIIDALRFSMNIPMFFTKLQYQGDYYSDGFLLMNFPLYFFDEPNGWLCNDSVQLAEKFLGDTPPPTNNTIGIMTLDPDESIDKDSGVVINNLNSYISAILNTLLNNIQQQYLKSDFKERTIIIKLPFKINPTDFQPTKSVSTQLLQVGFDSAKDFILTQNLYTT